MQDEVDDTSSSIRRLDLNFPRADPCTPSHRSSRVSITPSAVDRLAADTPTRVNPSFGIYAPDSTPVHSEDPGRSTYRADSSMERSTANDIEEPHVDRKGVTCQKSQFFEKQFGHPLPHDTATARLFKDSVIAAEIKFNCSLDGKKQRFLSDLTFSLSEIYQKPASCIMVVACPDVSIILGENNEPAYYLTLTALSSDIAATKNKRCAYMVQNFVANALQIPPHRGVVKFEAIDDENFATNGSTALHTMERLLSQSDSGAVDQAGIRHRFHLRKRSTQSRTQSNTLVSPSLASTPAQLPGTGPTEDKRDDLDAKHTRYMKTKRSFMSLFGRVKSPTSREPNSTV